MPQAAPPQTPAARRLTLSAAPVFLAFAQPDGGDDVASRDVEFSGDLYTGQKANGIYVDLASLQIERAEMPVLLQHDPARVIGIQTVTNTGTALVTKGRLFTSHDADARSVVLKARAGLQWQMSLGVFEGQWVQLDPANQPHTINGRAVASGEYVVRNGLLREGSIVSIGADPQTSADFFSPNPTSANPTTEPTTAMTTEALQAAQAENAALKAQLAQLEAAQAQAEAQARQTAAKALFAQLGRDYTDALAAPYLALSAPAIAQLAADIQTHLQKSQAAQANANPAAHLPGHFTQGAFDATATNAPAAGQSVLLASAKAMHGLR